IMWHKPAFQKTIFAKRTQIKTPLKPLEINKFLRKSQNPQFENKPKCFQTQPQPPFTLTPGHRQGSRAPKHPLLLLWKSNHLTPKQAHVFISPVKKRFTNNPESTSIPLNQILIVVLLPTLGDPREAANQKPETRNQKPGTHISRVRYSWLFPGDGYVL